MNTNIKRIIFFSFIAFFIVNIGCSNNVVKKMVQDVERSVEHIIGYVTKLSIELSAPVYSHGKDADRVNEIGRKMLPFVKRKRMNYSFKVIDLPYPNAFAVPGGYIYVTKRLVRMSTDDELACIIGHELGHIQARHSIKAFKKNLIAKKIIDYYSKKSDTVKKNKELLIIANSIFNDLRFSRENEREADRFGIDFAIKTGYNPFGMITFFKKLADLNKGGENEALKMLRTHPLTAERIKYSELYIKKRLQ